jgi:hypothetical protein
MGLAGSVSSYSHRPDILKIFPTISHLLILTQYRYRK